MTKNLQRAMERRNFLTTLGVLPWLPALLQNSAALEKSQRSHIVRQDQRL